MPSARAPISTDFQARFSRACSLIVGNIAASGHYTASASRNTHAHVATIRRGASITPLPAPNILTKPARRRAQLTPLHVNTGEHTEAHVSTPHAAKEIDGLLLSCAPRIFISLQLPLCQQRRHTHYQRKCRRQFIHTFISAWLPIRASKRHGSFMPVRCVSPRRQNLYCHSCHAASSQ